MRELFFKGLLAFSIILGLVSIHGCAQYEPQECLPKSDTQIIAETISDILVPKYREC